MGRSLATRLRIRARTIMLEVTITPKGGSDPPTALRRRALVRLPERRYRAVGRLWPNMNGGYVTRPSTRTALSRRRAALAESPPV